MHTYNAVGPVLITGELSEQVLAAIKKLNPSVEIKTLGAYIRVLAVDRCYVTKSAVEEQTGQTFSFPESLELIMPSFKGIMTCTPEQVTWSFKEH